MEMKILTYSNLHGFYVCNLITYLASDTEIDFDYSDAKAG